jgi:Tol biopolymer transport system component
MINVKSSHWVLIAALILCGCSINISQTPVADSTSQAQTVSTAPPASSSSGGSPSQQNLIGNPSLPTTTIPVTWSGLNLTGTLVYQSSVQNGSIFDMSIQALDLATGEISTVFQAPDTSWIDFASVSPDGKQLVMAYLPPKVSGAAPTNGQQAIYTMPVDGSQPPQLLFQPPSSGDQYFQPVWSRDGKYIYFSHVDYSAPPKVQGQHFAYYELFRIAYPGGQPEKLVDEAYWPRLSRDGARLAFVTLDPVDGSNKLFVANPDGSGAYQVALSGRYVPPIIDAPVFTIDDKLILYSAVTPTQSSGPNWWERLLGISVASAHTVPSDWWSVPIGGGTPTQLTHIAVAGLFASLSSDGKYIASYSGKGLFIMDQNGQSLTTLIGDLGGLPGTVNWLP